MEDYSKYFPFSLGEDQKRVFDALCNFLNDRNSDVFILIGYAGTGKTSLIGGFIKYLYDSNTPNEINVLSSTGRAAKILSDKTVVHARTIHSMLYKPSYIEDDTKVIQFELFTLKELSGNTRIYIVDEASMVSDIENPTVSAAKFGEGNVLKDLFRYDPGGKFIFVGDPCQLNPIGQKMSPALEPEHLSQKYGKRVVVHSLNQIYRQQGDNDILLAATNLRKMWQKHTPNFTSVTRYGIQEPFTQLPLIGFQRIKPVMSESELIYNYVNLIRQKGYNYSTMICHSNKECFNAGTIVRQMLHNPQAHLVKGDLLLITQNNYLVDLVNGDLVEVKEIFHETRTTVANISFVKVEVSPLHKRECVAIENGEYVSSKGYKLYLTEDTLTQGTLNLDSEQTMALMKDFVSRMAKHKIFPPRKNNKTDHNHPFFAALSKDPFMNALRASYGYVLTCHKAQGGEWEEVFVNLAGAGIYARRGKELYQWAYTAITRAKEVLYLIVGQFVKQCF
jgi:ATP-dependent exoDNAse (exonuclease V) alpha subunit